MKRQYPIFSEKVLEILDFARCQRADGSFYGIAPGKKCRKGKEVGPKEIKALQAKAKAGSAKAKKALEKLSKTEDPERPASKPAIGQKTPSAIKSAPKKPKQVKTATVSEKKNEVDSPEAETKKKRSSSANEFHRDSTQGRTESR